MHYIRNVTFDLNQFADLSPQEFRQQILMPHQMVTSLPKDQYVVLISFNSKVSITS